MRNIFGVLVITVTLCLSKQKSIKEQYLRKLQNGEFQMPHKWVNGSEPHIMDDAGSITAVLDDYADAILKNIGQLIIRNGLDPVELPNDTLKLIPMGKITLTQGWLQDLSTLSRNKDVKVVYRSSKKSLEVQVPIKFDDLMFTYDYHTQVFPLSIRGGLQGRVMSVKINIILSYSFIDYKAQLSSFDIKDTGSISIEFTGHKLVDWLTNIVTSVIEIFIRPIIMNILNWLIKDSLDSVIEDINKATECFLDRNVC